MERVLIDWGPPM